jgi:hypothetical protein
VFVQQDILVMQRMTIDRRFRCLPIIEAMFLKFYSASLKRPWLKSAESAFSDARYRLSVPLAAPFVALTAGVVVMCRRISPTPLSRQNAAILICLSLVAAGVGTFIALGRIFKKYLKAPDLALQSNQPPGISEIVLNIVLWSCVVAYCVLMTCL